MSSIKNSSNAKTDYKPPARHANNNNKKKADLKLVDPRQATLDREMELGQEIARLEAKCEALDKRLTEGVERIDAARAKGKDVSEWEDYWLKLLGQYKQVSEQLAALKSQKV